MHAYTATVSWSRGDQPFADGQYSRGHMIAFDGGVSIAGSSSPQSVRLPLSKEDAADPEEMLVAALSSCHMLFFLDLARRAGFVIDEYIDQPEGLMGKDERGRAAITKITLKPAIVFSGDKRPSAADLNDLHHKAHEACYIANSIHAEVVIGS
jgi:organic hydroperoxide reductase OsmC/OhrA